jgi:serine acetyltransferase
LLATPNRFWPIEPHFDLPALSWLPSRWLRDLYVRLAGKGQRYDVDLCTSRSLSKLADAACLTTKDASFDLSEAILAEKAGACSRLLRLMRPLWSVLRPALPSVVVLLERSAIATSATSPMAEALVDPVRRFRRQNYFLSAWRIGSFLQRHHVPFFPTAWRIACQVIFHADVPAQVRIPRDVVFMHNGLGTVIHTNVEFRGTAIVYHNVTIGMSHKIDDGAPVIGKNVLIGANAVILGPVEIGDHSIVAAGAVVTKSVPSGHMAIGNPAVIKPANLEILQSLFGPLKPAPEAGAEKARAA